MLISQTSTNMYVCVYDSKFFLIYYDIDILHFPSPTFPSRGTCTWIRYEEA